ncbi:hypothetical protein BDR06DRAFT_977544 [Suillus hirtellus]|nr:hypothetical protein BDR06DRAFT_977544 [Suillus hirtellus]
MKNTPRILRASEKLTGKPRLAYDFETLRLEVNMPSEIHPSLTLNTGKKEFVPNYVHVVTARCKPPVVKIPSIVEVAFSQSEAALLDRFQNAIKFYPELGMILMLVINETPPFLSPKPLGHTWRKLHPRDNKPHHSALVFLSLQDEPQSFDEPTPVIVEGHSWCAITDIQVQVWVQGRRGAINIDTKDSRLTAHRSLFPVYNEAAMKDEQCRLADRDASVSNLCSAQLPLPLKWEDIVDSLTYAMQATAHAQYLTWYHNILEEQSEEYVEVTGKRTADEAEIDTPDDGHLVRLCIGMKTCAAARSASYGEKQLPVPLAAQVVLTERCGKGRALLVKPFPRLMEGLTPTASSTFIPMLSQASLRKPFNWTTGCLEAQQCGLPSRDIMIWTIYQLQEIE